MTARRNCPGVGTEAATKTQITDEAISDSVVDQTTVMAEAQARSLTSRIKLNLTSLADLNDKVLGQIEQARSGDAHLALGFASWPAYVEQEFGGALARLDRDRRRDVVRVLTEQGMSTRAIAPIFEVSHDTIHRDVAAVRNLTPDPVAEQDLEPAAPEPRKVRRRPLPDQYRSAVYELQKAVERLERLHADDRFGRNRADLADRNTQLTELAERAAKMAQQLGGEGR